MCWGHRDAVHISVYFVIYVYGLYCEKSFRGETAQFKNVSSVSYLFLQRYWCLILFFVVVYFYFSCFLCCKTKKSLPSLDGKYTQKWLISCIKDNLPKHARNNRFLMQSISETKENQIRYSS